MPKSCGDPSQMMTLCQEYTECKKKNKKKNPSITKMNFQPGVFNVAKQKFITILVAPCCSQGATLHVTLRCYLVVCGRNPPPPEMWFPDSLSNFKQLLFLIFLNFFKICSHNSFHLQKKFPPVTFYAFLDVSCHPECSFFHPKFSSPNFFLMSSGWSKAHTMLLSLFLLPKSVGKKKNEVSSKACVLKLTKSSKEAQKEIKGPFVIWKRVFITCDECDNQATRFLWTQNQVCRLIDQCKLNTKVDNVALACPMPCIQNIFGCVLCGDLVTGIQHAFYMIELDPSSHKFTAFSCELGKWQFRFLPQCCPLSQGSHGWSHFGWSKSHSSFENTQCPSVQIGQLQLQTQPLEIKCQFMQRKVSHAGPSVLRESHSVTTNLLVWGSWSSPKCPVKSRVSWDSPALMFPSYYSDMTGLLQLLLSEEKLKGEMAIGQFWTSAHHFEVYIKGCKIKHFFFAMTTNPWRDFWRKKVRMRWWTGHWSKIWHPIQVGQFWGPVTVLWASIFWFPTQLSFSVRCFSNEIKGNYNSINFPGGTPS